MHNVKGPPPKSVGPPCKSLGAPVFFSFTAHSIFSPPAHIAAQKTQTDPPGRPVTKRRQRPSGWTRSRLKVKQRVFFQPKKPPHRPNDIIIHFLLGPCSLSQRGQRSLEKKLRPPCAFIFLLIVKYVSYFEQLREG